MNNKLLKLAVVLLSFAVAPFAHATTDWSAQDYDLYPGDFDGDGKTDILYIAKDPAKPSGIALSDANGAADTAWQTWPSNYLGIPWSGNQYNIVVADFDGDGKADIFMQKNVAGDHYLLLTDAAGKVTAISQAIPNNCRGIAWSADQHKVLVGNFSGDTNFYTYKPMNGFFLQATNTAGINGLIRTHVPTSANDTSAGLIDGCENPGLDQSWTDGYLGLKWSTQSAVVYAGDFNGDYNVDLLVQAKPVFVMIDYDVAFPVPTYSANMNGVVFSQGGTEPFQLTGVQTWSRLDKGVDWSPLSNTLVIGDFDGDGVTDVLLQAKYSGKTSNLLKGDTSGAAFSTAPTAISSNVGLTSDVSKLIVGNFAGGTTAGAGLYIQTLSSGGTNYVANSVGATMSAALTILLLQLVWCRRPLSDTPLDRLLSATRARRPIPFPLWCHPGC
jgi:hypothetical protein